MDRTRIIQFGRPARIVWPAGPHGRPLVFATGADGVMRRVLDGVHQSAVAARQVLLPPALVALAGVRVEGWIDSEEGAFLNDWFAAVARTFVPSHIGLFTTTPADDGTGGVEATGGSYARQAFARNATNWPAATVGAPSSIDNGVAVTFPQATANWGTIASWGYFDALSAGNLGFWATLDTAKAVNNGDTANFPIGALVGQFGDPGDTY